MEKLLEFVQFIASHTFTSDIPINLLFFTIIALLFIIGLFVVTMSTIVTRKGIGQGSKYLIGVDLKNINEQYFGLEDKFNNDSFFKEQWREFDETLRKLDIDGEITYYNTAEVSHFLNSESLYYRRFASDFYFALPTILTGLGILGTFVGLVFGLQFFEGVDFANTESVAGASQGLLSGIGASFITSVWGLFFSISLNLIYSRLKSVTEQRISTFTDKIEALFPRHISAEGEGLFEIKKELEKHTTALESFSTKVANAVSSALEDGITKSLAPTIDKMSVVMEKFSTEKAENVSHMVGDFKDSLTSAARAEMENLKGTLQGITNSLDQSKETFTDMLSNWQNSVNQQNDMSSSQRELIESFNKNLETVKNSSFHINDITEKQKNVLKDFNLVIENVEQLSNIISPLKVVLEMANKASEKYTTTAQLMDSSASNFKEGMEMNNQLVNSQKETLGDLLPLANEFKGIIGSIKNPLMEITTTVQDLKNIETIKSETFSKVDSLSIGLNSFLEKINEHEAYLQNMVTKLHSTNDSVQSIWSSYKSSVENIQSEINKGIVQYTDTMRTKTEETFKLYDESLSSGLGNISRTINELVESFDSLGDKLDELNGVEN